MTSSVEMLSAIIHEAMAVGSSGMEISRQCVEGQCWMKWNSTTPQKAAAYIKEAKLYKNSLKIIFFETSETLRVAMAK